MGYLIGFIMIFVILAILGLSITKTKRNKQIAAVIAFVIAAGSMIAIHQAILAPSASYAVVVRTFKQMPDQYVRVYLNVTNVGKSAGTPTCSVTVQPTSSAGDLVGNGGVDAGTLTRAIQPGATNFAYLDILVAGNDANLVTSKSMITASCS
jgi:hypothetical protein